MPPDLPYWEVSQATRARLRRGDGGQWRRPKRQAPQGISATSISRTKAMHVNDQQQALNQLPPDLRADAELTALVAQTLGVTPGHALSAAAQLVTAYRAREAGSRG